MAGNSLRWKSRFAKRRAPQSGGFPPRPHARERKLTWCFLWGSPWRLKDAKSRYGAASLYWWMASAWVRSASATEPKIKMSTSPRPALAPSNVSDLKQLAREIFHETLAALDIPLIMRQKLARKGSQIRIDETAIDLAAYDRIVVIAIGKASVTMARGFADLLASDFAFEGILVAPHESVADVRGFRSIGA